MSEVIQTLADTFEDAILTSYSVSNEELKSALYNIVKQFLKEVVLAGIGGVFDELQSACLTQSVSIVEQNNQISFFKYDVHHTSDGYRREASAQVV